MQAFMWVTWRTSGKYSKPYFIIRKYALHQIGIMRMAILYSAVMLMERNKSQALAKYIVGTGDHQV